MKEREESKILIDFPVELRLQLKSIASIRRVTMRKAIIDYVARGIITDYLSLGLLDSFSDRAQRISKYIISSDS